MDRRCSNEWRVKKDLGTAHNRPEPSCVGTLKWVRPITIGPTHLQKGRFGHTSVLMGGKMVLYGGDDGRNNYGISINYVEILDLGTTPRCFCHHLVA